MQIYIEKSTENFIMILNYMHSDAVFLQLRSKDISILNLYFIFVVSLEEY